MKPLDLNPNLIIIFGVTLMAVMGVSSVAPVFPTVAQELDVSTEAVGLLITVFTLPGIFLAPLFGILADRYGRKPVLVPALVLFALAGSACSLARDFQTLLVLRFFQGVGAASLGSLNATLIGDLFPGRQRASAMGYNASVLSIGTAIYPAVGGALAAVGWYVPFVLPVLGLLVALAVLFWLDTVEVGGRARFTTYFGQALSTMANRKVLGLFTVSVVTFVVLYGAYLTFIPLHLADRFDSSALQIGVIMSVGSLSTAITASRLGPLNRFFSEERLIITAFILYALSFVVIPFLPGHWWVALPVALFGVAQGFNYPGVMSLLAGLAPTEHRGIFMAVNGMVLRSGQTLGPLVMAGVFAWGGMAQVFYAAAGICGAMYLVLPWIIGRGAVLARG